VRGIKNVFTYVGLLPSSNEHDLIQAGHRDTGRHGHVL